MYGGRRGIRTPEAISDLHAFQACAFDHSAIPPKRHGSIEIHFTASKQSLCIQASLKNLSLHCIRIKLQNMEIKNQHKRNVYNLGFTFLFVGLIAAQMLSLWKLDSNPSLDLTDFILLTLAIFRLTRLFVYDGVCAFIRDLFVDIKEHKGQLIRTKKVFGLERALSDIFSCPWCFSLWGGSVFIWAYLMFPSVMLYVALILSISSLASVLQITTNLIGWKAEHAKNLAEASRP